MASPKALAPRPPRGVLRAHVGSGRSSLGEPSSPRVPSTRRRSDLELVPLCVPRLRERALRDRLVLARADDRPFARLPRVSQLASAGATLLLFLLLNIEIADWYSTGRTVTFDFSSSTLAQDLTYTMGWAAFAVALLAAGVIVRVKATRIAALVLLLVTIVKCFFHDLARLDGLYRVGSFVALAFCLALVAVVLQRFVLMPDAPEPSKS